MNIMIEDLKKIPVVLHIGYHKTATTYLQKHVFPAHSQLLYPGRPFATEAINRFFLTNQFTHPLHFDAGKMADSFYLAISEWVSESNMGLMNKKSLLVSHESLHSGPDWFGNDVVMMADRMKAVFPDAGIIIGIRNQVDYIESNYKEYILHGGRLSYKKFISDSFAFNYGLLPKLYFDKVVAYYFRLFGKDRVHIYLLEELKNEPLKVLHSMMKFMGVNAMPAYKSENVNVGLSRSSSRLLRAFNKLLASDFNEQYYRWMHHRLSPAEKLRRRIGRLLKKVDSSGIIFSGKKITNIETTTYLENLYRDSNKNLSRLLGKDLAKSGYAT